MIGLGAEALIARFHWIIYVFKLPLITAITLFLDEEDAKPTQIPVDALARTMVPGLRGISRPAFHREVRRSSVQR